MKIKGSVRAEGILQADTFNLHLLFYPSFLLVDQKLIYNQI